MRQSRRLFASQNISDRKLVFSFIFYRMPVPTRRLDNAHRQFRVWALFGRPFDGSVDRRGRFKILGVLRTVLNVLL